MLVLTQKTKNFSKMFHRSHIFISIVLISTFLFGCGKQIPDDVIDPSEMEDILYDYHLANVMGDELQYNEYYNKELYNKYVFEKYNITSEKFDSSMLWYSKHADELTKIYKNVDKRFAKNSKLLEDATANLNVKREKSFSGDTIDIWNKSDLVWLTSSELTNKVLFTTIADTSFRANDMYIMDGDFHFLSSGKQIAIICVNITLDNDSVVGRTEEVNFSGHRTLFLSANVAPYKVRSVNGFIYYKGNRKLSGMLANNISLLKIHNKYAVTPANDTTSVSNPAQTMPTETLQKPTLDSVQKIMTTVDSSMINQIQPLKNDPLSIKARTPRKRRQVN